MLTRHLETSKRKIFILFRDLNHPSTLDLLHDWTIDADPEQHVRQLRQPRQPQLREVLRDVTASRARGYNRIVGHELDVLEEVYQAECANCFALDDLTAHAH